MSINIPKYKQETQRYNLIDFCDIMAAFFFLTLRNNN